MKKTILTGALLLVMSASAMAAEGFYVYGGAGYAKADTDLSCESYAGSAGQARLDVDEKSFGLKLAGGYRFNDWFALEGSYVYLGKAQADLTVKGHAYGADVDAKAAASMKAHVLAFDAVSLYPIAEKVDLFAKASIGLGYVETKLGFSGTVDGYKVAGGFSESDTRVFPKLGLGVEYQVTDKVAVRAEYERYFSVSKDSDYTVDADYDLLSVGVKYTF